MRLTPAGREAFAPLQQRSREEAAALLRPADTPADLASGVVLRDPQPGDMGWVVQQHGEVYAREYVWGSTFEALVAELVAGYLRKFQPGWERCWIAELDGQRVGSVFVERKPPRRPSCAC